MSSSKNKILNDELIILIKNTLRICDGVRQERKKTDGAPITIKARNCSETVVYTGKECNFAEKLLNYIFFAAHNKESDFEIRSFVDAQSSSTTISLKVEQGGLRAEFTEDCPNFGEIKAILPQLFVANQLQLQFIEKINKLESLMQSFEVLKPFVEREQIAEYWLSYVDVLVFLLNNEEFIAEPLGKKKILKPLLNFCDVEKLSSGSTNAVCISLFSPISLYLLLIIYDKLEEYLELEIQDNEADFELIYHEIFVKQVLHAFRWFLADENQNMYHAALTPFVEKRSSAYNLLIPVHKLDSYNSYEGIRELRLAEKIIFELDNWELLENEEALEGVCYKVAIFGDLQKQPVCELGDYLTKIIENGIALKEQSKLQTISIRLQLDVYTKTQYSKNEDCSGSSGKYSYQFYRLDEVLKNRKQLDEVFDTHHLMFLLDNIDLYNKMSVEEYYNPEFYKQRLKYFDYRNCLESIKKQHSISYNGMFKELHETLTAYLYSGKWGRFKKTANNNLLRYLESKVCESKSRKAIYVYVSDLEAFYDVYCNDTYYVRKEQYNDKEIGIIRYSTRKEEILKNNLNSQYILSFNMWQFVKHIVIEERHSFLKSLLPGLMEKADLKQIHIGIQYDKWRERLIFDYCLEKEELITPQVVNAVERFVCKTLIPIFNETDACLYSEYIHKSVCSFLYGNVANVEDMLFLHLYKNHRDLIGRAEYTKTHNPDMVRNSINKKFKYSFKRFYEMAMQTYDISASEYIGQYRAVEMIRRSDELQKAWRDASGSMHLLQNTKEGVFKQILDACENLQYTKSYLYNRCNEELKKG